MVEHGLYILKKDFFDLISSLGGDCDRDAGGKRPVYCCLKDTSIDGLYWAIPTTELSHRSDAQKKKYAYFLSLKKKDIRSCYYHRARTTVDAIYKVSSCFPITEKYVEHEFTTSGNHVVLQQKNDINEISRKLHKILAVEQRRPNYFSQHITDIKNALIKELSVLHS